VAGALFLAALITGSWGTSSAPASTCGGSPGCNGGPPPAMARSVAAQECGEPKCLSGTEPAQAGHGQGRVLATGSTSGSPPPPPHPNV
jgi:hypothetical protein